jgi:hypothetical protein
MDGDYVHADSYKDAKTSDVVKVRQQFLMSVSSLHYLLLDVCLGFVPVPRTCDALSKESLTASNLGKLHAMVQIEVMAGLAKDRQGTEDSTRAPADPHPFDVFLMNTTLERNESSLAVCLPIKDDLVWYDGMLNVWPLDGFSHKWRVASLSGAARVLEALSSRAADLMHWAMERSMLVDVERNVDSVRRLLPDMLESMNESQQQAIATAASPALTKVFLRFKVRQDVGKRQRWLEWCLLWQKVSWSSRRQMQPLRMPQSKSLRQAVSIWMIYVYLEKTVTPRSIFCRLVFAARSMPSF